MAEESHCLNCTKMSEVNTSLQQDSQRKDSLPAMLLLDKHKTLGDSRQTSSNKVKPNIFKLPESDVLARMKSFVPFLSEPKADNISADCDSVVKFIPLSDSEDSSGSDCESEDTDNEGPHVEMRLAVVPDTASDSEDDGGSHEDMLLGEVTANNLRLPQMSCHRSAPPVIEELD